MRLTEALPSYPLTSQLILPFHQLTRWRHHSTRWRRLLTSVRVCQWGLWSTSSRSPRLTRLIPPTCSKLWHPFKVAHRHNYMYMYTYRIITQYIIELYLTCSSVFIFSSLYFFHVQKHESEFLTKISVTFNFTIRYTVLVEFLYKFKRNWYYNCTYLCVRYQPSLCICHDTKCLYVKIIISPIF